MYFPPINICSQPPVKLEMRTEMQIDPHVNERDLFCPIVTKLGVDGRRLVKVLCIER